MRLVLRKATSTVSKLTREENYNKSREKKLSNDEIFLRNAKDLYEKGYLDKALMYFEKIKATISDPNRNRVTVDRSEEINGYLLNIYCKLAKRTYAAGEYLASLEYYEKLLSLNEQKKDTKCITETLSDISDVLKFLTAKSKSEGNYNDAMQYAQRRREIHEKIGKSLPEVYDDLEEIFSFKARECNQKGNYKQAIFLYEKLKEIHDRKHNTDGLLEVYGILGNLYYETSQIRNAVSYFNKYKDLAENKKQYKKKMSAFKQLGICHQVIKDYKTALVNFKLLLQLAWKEENIEMELTAYDYMSIQYFYLGDLDGARYYHNRIWKGATEKMESRAREISNKVLEASKNKQKIPPRELERVQSAKKGKFISDVAPDIEIGLPSPRTSSGESDVQFLPMFPSKIIANNPSRVKITSKKTFKALNKTVEIKKTTEKNPKNVKPFVLLSHLSPIESIKNFFYVDQIDYHK